MRMKMRLCILTSCSFLWKFLQPGDTMRSVIFILNPFKWIFPLGFRLKKTVKKTSQVKTFNPFALSLTVSCHRFDKKRKDLRIAWINGDFYVNTMCTSKFVKILWTSTNKNLFTRCPDSIKTFISSRFNGSHFQYKHKNHLKCNCTSINLASEKKKNEARNTKIGNDSNRNNGTLHFSPVIDALSEHNKRRKLSSYDANRRCTNIENTMYIEHVIGSNIKYINPNYFNPVQLIGQLYHRNFFTHLTFSDRFFFFCLAVFDDRKSINHLRNHFSWQVSQCNAELFVQFKQGL